MDVYFGTIESSVRLGEGGTRMDEILRKVMALVDEREEHTKRVQDERRVTGGVRDEMEADR
jgi:hypothetical protein